MAGGQRQKINAPERVPVFVVVDVDESTAGTRSRGTLAAICSVIRRSATRCIIFAGGGAYNEEIPTIPNLKLPCQEVLR